MDGSNEKECCTLCDGFGIISPELDMILWDYSIVCPCCGGKGIIETENLKLISRLS